MGRRREREGGREGEKWVGGGREGKQEERGGGGGGGGGESWVKSKLMQIAYK